MLSKKELAREFRFYLICSLYLIGFSFGLTAYRRLLLGQYPLNLGINLYGVVESLILAKIIIIGKHFHLGERFHNKPLIIPTLYKTFIFCLFVLFFHLLEHFVVGFFKGESLLQLGKELTELRMEEVGLKTAVQFFAFIYLFAFIELDRVMGEDKLFDLFFRRRTTRL